MPFLIALGIAFALGFGLSYQIDHVEIASMEAANQSQNNEARIMLSVAQSRATEAQNAALIANANLDKAHESAIQTINALHGSLATARLRDPGWKGCRNTVPQSHSTGQSQDEAGDGQLSTVFNEFLVNESYRADQVATYADECSKFITQLNFGLR